jgi:hypothetical protein
MVQLAAHDELFFTAPFLQALRTRSKRMAYLNAYCASYTDGLRSHIDHKSTGLWLFRRNTSAPLSGVSFDDGLVAEWDPEMAVGLAIVVPSEEDDPDEESTQELKMHFLRPTKPPQEFKRRLHA